MWLGQCKAFYKETNKFMQSTQSLWGKTLKNQELSDWVIFINLKNSLEIIEYPRFGSLVLA